MIFQGHRSNRLHWTYLRLGPKRNSCDNTESWDRSGVYLTKYGIVAISIWHWKLRDIWHDETEFEVVTDGSIVSGKLNVSNLSERQLKIAATKFIKQTNNL